MDGFGLVVGIACAGVYVLLTPIGLRLLRAWDPAFAILVLAAGTCAAGLASAVVAKLGMNLWLFLVGFWAPAACFVLFFGAVYKSLSLRILLDLSSAPGHAEPLESLYSRYVFGDSYSNRLALMVSKGLVMQRPDGYTLTATGRAWALRLHAAQRFFSIRRSG